MPFKIICAEQKLSVFLPVVRQMDNLTIKLFTAVNLNLNFTNAHNCLQT